MAKYGYMIEMDIYKDHQRDECYTKVVDVEFEGSFEGGEEDHHAFDMAIEKLGVSNDDVKYFWILTVDIDGKNVFVIE